MGLRFGELTCVICNVSMGVSFFLIFVVLRRRFVIV